MVERDEIVLAMKQVRIVVSGRVQGVSFRASAQQRARELNVTGFVRNLSSGKVEIVGEGAEEALDELAEWARKGPPPASVNSAQIQFGEASGNYTGFEIWGTAVG